MAKRPSIYSISSRQLEEDIHVPLHLIGTPEWTHNSIAEGSVDLSAITTVRSGSDLSGIKAALENEKVLGIDSETGGDNKRDGLDPIASTSRMLIFQLGTPKMVYLIEPKLVPEFKEILESQQHLFITQNGVHDYKFALAKYGVHFINYYYDKSKDTCIPCIYDTMLAEQILSAGLFGVQVGLEELAEKYPPHYLISKAIRKEFIDLRGVLEYRHLYYAARDVLLLFHIRTGQMAQIKKYPGMWERLQIEFCAIDGTADAELTGFDLDEARIGNIIEYYKNKASNIRTQVIALFNDYLAAHHLRRNFVLPDSLEEFDLDSAGQKLAALRKMGMEIVDVKRETLQELDTEITNLLGEYSKCTKIISTYGEGLLAKKSKTTGRLHPEFNQLGSGDLERKKGAKATTIDTGRWSSDAQQFPRPEHILAEVSGNEASKVISLFSTQYKEAAKKLQEAK